MRSKKKHRTEMDEVHKRGVANASKVIEKYTFPFLTTSDKTEPELIASCIFVELEGRCFLVTAAHAFRANRQGLFTRGAGRLIDVTGKATVSKDENADNFDIASILIDPEIIREHQIPVLPISMWTLSVEVESPHSRAVSGFPVSMNKTARALDRRTKTFTGKCFTYFGSANYSGEYEKFGKTRDSHVGIELLSGTDDSGNYISTPIWPPRGLSGGGAWLIPDLAGC